MRMQAARPLSRSEEIALAEVAEDRASAEVDSTLSEYRECIETFYAAPGDQDASEAKELARDAYVSALDALLAAQERTDELR